MDHSFEEIRKVALDILAERETVRNNPNYLRTPDQYNTFSDWIAEVLTRREQGPPQGRHQQFRLSDYDRNVFLEVFWDLFRQGIITLGLNDSNPEFPWFHVSEYGRRIIVGQNIYFYHDVATYEALTQAQVPNIDSVTVLYLKEAMQAFMSGCLLSAAVMVGVASEHTFGKLLETIEVNPAHEPIYRRVIKERFMQNRLNEFQKLIHNIIQTIPRPIRDDLDTNLFSLASIMRSFRNQSGHPTGQMMNREQVYVLLNVFIPCCKKMYELIAHFT